MEKENWKDKVMDSFEGIERSKPRADLFDEVWSNVQSKTTIERKIIPMNTLRMIAACILLLLALNTYVINNQLKANDNDELAISERNDYQNLLTNYNIYE